MDYKTFYFSKIYKLVRKDNIIFTKWCKKWKLSYMDMNILLAIYDNNGKSEPTALAEELLIPKQTITSILDKLEKNEYIKRIHSNTDRRKVNISLDSKGSELVSMAVNVFAENEKRILKEISQEDLDKSIEIYNKALSLSEKFVNELKENE